jgi:hypothetical protein
MRCDAVTCYLILRVALCSAQGSVCLKLGTFKPTLVGEVRLAHAAIVHLPTVLLKRGSADALAHLGHAD